MRRAVVLIVVALLAPLAAAGTEARPEIIDNPDQVAKEVDLRAAWVEAERDGLRFTVKVQGADTMPTNKMWTLVFETPEGGVWIAGVATTSSGSLRTTLQRPGFNTAPTAFRDELADPSFRTGAPAYASALIPWGAVEGLSRGANVTLTGAGTDSRSNNVWRDIDYAYTEVRIDTDVGLIELTPTWAWWMAAATLVVAVVVAAGIRTRGRRRARGPVAPPAGPAGLTPSSGGAAPPSAATRQSNADRFRLDPRK